MPRDKRSAFARRSYLAARSYFCQWSFSGLVGAVLGFALALTPSLLPRPGAFLGVVAGVGTAVGYGLGLLVGRLLRALRVPRAGEAAMRRWRRGLAIVGPLVVLVALVVGGLWQLQVQKLSGEEPSQVGLLVALVVAPLVALLLLQLGRGLRWLARRLARLLGRWVPRRVAQGIAVVAVAAFAWWVISGVIVDSLMAMFDTIYADANAGTDPGVVQPEAPQRSGSPASLLPWSTLGSQGRNFVAGGPTPASLQAFSGRPAREPIRVYVGLDSAGTAQQRAPLAVQELNRTGAFDRPVLVVAGATGTGWLEPETMSALEYEWNGDSAIVTIQYSYLPSWISFLTDQARAQEAGRALYQAVHTAWRARPAGSRPELVSYGLSLGSFTAQSAFPSIDGVVSGTDAAFYVGTPGFSQPWLDVTAARDPGSPQWLPVYQGGKVVRFSAGAQLTAAGGRPHVLYLQHGNDPVVWWDWNLLWARPDWLSGEHAPGVSPHMRWLPVVTFLQVTIDQFFGTAVPLGQGHNYANSSVAAWALVVPPDGWTAADSARLQKIVVP